jgi:isoquinoline 1-oxidoreductase subunit beta
VSSRVLLTRRDLLKLGALAGGGLLLGIALPSIAREESKSSSPSKSGPFEPNAWLRIGSDGSIAIVVARSEMGQGVSTALPMLIAEELEVSLGAVAIEFAPAAPAYVNRMLGQQVTGGSTSVREGWTILREAGALARTLLVQAAAATWKVPESECTARHGRVQHKDGKRSLGYGELAALASTLPIPQSVQLKAPQDWTLIGTEQPRLDTPAKVSGRARFGIDVRLPGMVYASIERCPIFGGRVRRFDASAAKSSPGVIDVLKIDSGIAVVASDTWSALRARRLLKVDWDPVGNGHLDSAGLRQKFRKLLDKPGSLANSVGNAQKALSAATTRLEAEYEVPFQAHACMEPMNCTAIVAADRCEIHAPTQAQTRALETARRLTGLPEAQIAIHTTYLGGGFGRRLEQDFVADAIALAKRLGRAVQVVWTREDDLTHDFYRPMTLNRLSGGLDADGKPVGWHHRIVGPSILARVKPAAIKDGIDPTSVEGAAQIPYDIPNLRVEYRRADTPVPVGFWRSVGSSQNAFVVECFLDELARAAGRDPLELRRALLAGKPRHLKVLNLAAERAGWDRPLGQGRARGIAFAECFGSIVAEVAQIAIVAGKLKIERVVCAIDCGRVVNPDTVRAQVRGAVVFGLTAALKGAITISGGRVEQSNFHDYPLLRFDESPDIDVYTVPSEAEPGGVGEPGTPPIAPAVANAVFALTGTPVRALPIQLGTVPASAQVPPEPPPQPKPQPEAPKEPQPTAGQGTQTPDSGAKPQAQPGAATEPQSQPVPQTGPSAPKAEPSAQPSAPAATQAQPKPTEPPPAPAAQPTPAPKPQPAAHPTPQPQPKPEPPASPPPAPAAPAGPSG